MDVPSDRQFAAILARADQKKRDVALRRFAIGLHGGELVVCDSGCALHRCATSSA
jgi:hypothetical protein